MKRESKLAKVRLQQYISLLDTYLKVSDIKQIIREMTGDSGDSTSENPVRRAAQVLVSLLQKFVRTWDQYKKQYLIPRVDRFYYFARYLEKVKTEKFVLNFYQFEFFPKIRFTSEIMLGIRNVASILANTNDGALISQGHLINKLLNRLQTDYDLDKSFPNEEVSKLFYKVDATFHSFFIRAQNHAVLEDFDYRVLSSDLENVLKGITDLTGGKNITSNDLVNSLDIVTEVEDVYYMLTYAPKNPQKAGKLKIKVKKKKYQVLYDDNFRADYINDYFKQLGDQLKTPDIKIEKFSFHGKILAFTIKDYMMRTEGKNTFGRMKVRIRLTNSNNNAVLFDSAKVLTAQKKEMKVSLGAFKQIQRGEYNFLIDTVDMLTGKEDNFHRKVTVR